MKTCKFIALYSSMKGCKSNGKSGENGEKSHFGLEEPEAVVSSFSERIRDWITYKMHF